MLLRLKTSAIALALLTGVTVLPAEAGNRYYGYDSYRHGSYMDRHPYVKKAAIGGGIGAAAGALLAREGMRTRGAVKGAIIGGAAGAGYEYLRRQGTFSRNRWGW